MYGFRVRIPLYALYNGLVECEHGKLNVCDWVANMADRLEFVRDAAALNLSKVREKRLIQMNKDAKQREFKVGSRVLYRLPGMTCKLGESWEGPYMVVERLGTVNYRISKDGMKRHSKAIHVNCLKEYVECGSVCRLDVVVEEECGERNKLEGVCAGFSQSELDGVLEEFGDVFSDRPGNTRKVLMTIDTGNHQPIRQAPYSVPLGIRDRVKEELEALEECGVIERCESAWSSPLVPVRKPDGGVRLCVDYRRLNVITSKEPYYIPGFDELVGKGRVLSKVDLSKGFHQVEVEECDRDKTCFTCPFVNLGINGCPLGWRTLHRCFSDCVVGV